jgi:uncharacterized membrane protein YhhN
VALGGVAVFLWQADGMAWSEAAIWVVALGASLWALGLFMQGRMAWLEVLVLQSATLATLSALGWIPGHFVFKPLTMVLAIIFVASRAYRSGARGRFDSYLLAALLFSLIGDVFLMVPGGQFFIPGLASFLIAHLFYITLFKQNQSWFPNRRAVAGVLAVGAVMYAVVWGGLKDPVLKAAVAAYVTVISLMAAQAWGRASVLKDAASRWVTLGACIFMVSDSLIAINKFVSPVPLSSFWILLTYYAAQMLIVHFAEPTGPSKSVK